MFGASYIIGGTLTFVPMSAGSGRATGTYWATLASGCRNGAAILAGSGRAANDCIIGAAGVGMYGAAGDCMYGAASGWVNGAAGGMYWEAPAAVYVVEGVGGWNIGTN